MVKVLYFTRENENQPFLQRVEACPPRIGERVKIFNNQNLPTQRQLYAVEDVTTSLAVWLGGGQEVKEVFLREIAISGQVIMGAENEVEGP